MKPGVAPLPWEWSEKGSVRKGRISQDLSDKQWALTEGRVRGGLEGKEIPTTKAGTQV